MKNVFLLLCSLFVSVFYFVTKSWNRNVLALSLIMLMSGFSLSAEERAMDNEVSGGDGTTIELDSDIYVGVVIGSGKVINKFVDKDGFANWGFPGSTTDYDNAETVGGVLIGRKLNINGVPLRLELDGTVGSVSASTNQLDPEGLDETAKTDIRWLVTARVGVEKEVGSATFFTSGGLALARVHNSVIDIDFGPNTPRHVDPDDSFRDNSIRLGWVAGIGVEFPIGEEAGTTRAVQDEEGWVLRLEGFYVDLGEEEYEVNHSGGNRCGSGGPYRPCIYNIETREGVLRLAIIKRFSL